MRTENNQNALTSALLRLLRPLVRTLLHRGVSAPAFCELVRQAYVEVAEADFMLAQRKQTTSRIAVLTGLNRIEVARLRKPAGANDDTTRARFHNRAARVISGWTRDARFAPDGNAADLPWEGDNGFAALVASYSGGMPARAVLDELKRVGCVRETAQGLLHLCAEAYIPVADDSARLDLFGMAASDLLGTLDHNLNRADAPSRLQLSVDHSRVTPQVAEQFRQLCDQRAMQLLKELDAWLELHAGSEQDSHANSPHDAPLQRVGVGIYFFRDQESGNEH